MSNDNIISFILIFMPFLSFSYEQVKIPPVERWQEWAGNNSCLKKKKKNSCLVPNQRGGILWPAITTWLYFLKCWGTLKSCVYFTLSAHFYLHQQYFSCAQEPCMSRAYRLDDAVLHFTSFTGIFGLDPEVCHASHPNISTLSSLVLICLCSVASVVSKSLRPHGL